MKAVQGDILKIEGIKYPVIVLSNDFFNESDKVIGCPITNDANEGPLHIKLRDMDYSRYEGYVLCEQLKYIDLSSRRFSKSGTISYYDIQNLTDAVIGMFDYQM